jgi:uncharacterized membrane protein
MEWAAVTLGFLAAAAALYGRYRTLPAFLTGPAVCQLEAGGCQVLFRTPTAALLKVPNAVLGIDLYCGMALGLLADWPVRWLLVPVTAALAMSIYLARYLLVNKLQCRICWVGHLANYALWLSLCARALLHV